MSVFEKLKKRQIEVVNDSLKTIREIAGGKGISDVEHGTQKLEVEIIDKPIKERTLGGNVFIPIPLVKEQNNYKEEKPTVSSPVEETKVAGVDYPMQVAYEGGVTFVWRGLEFSVPSELATNSFVAEVKQGTFELFKALAKSSKFRQEPTRPPAVVEVKKAVEKQRELSPIIKVLKDGSYSFEWGDYVIIRPKEEVTIDLIQKVMGSSYEVFAINAKAEGLKEASAFAQSETIEPQVQVGEDDLQSALKEATASMSQEQPTSMGEALKRAASEDRKYEEGKTFKYQSVRRKR